MQTLSGSELSLNYRSKSLAVGEALRLLHWVLLSFALFSLAVLMWAHASHNPWLTEVLSTLQIKDKPRDQSELKMFLVFAGFAVFGVSRPLVQLFGTSQIRLSADTLLMPVSFLISMHGRRQRLWNDIAMATFREGSRLLLAFKSGGHATIDLNLLSPQDKEQLLVLVQMRSSSDVVDSSVGAALSLIESAAVTGHKSFTDLWEADYNRRFSQTAFVPCEPGRTLNEGRYKVLSQLAFGGLSAVYFAECESRDKVIVKESAIPGTVNSARLDKAEEMLRSEADMLVKLKHDKIVAVRDFFMESNKAYLVLDYLPGQNLRQIIARQGPMSEDVVVDWMRQLTEILRYLHSQTPAIVHRDISPDNIMLCPDGNLKIIDFGAAMEFLVTATGTLVGKQCYMSPEQFKGKATTQSDIYSLGATIYFLLTGREPEPLAEAHLEDEGATPTPLQQLIIDCTRLDRKARVASADQLRTRLANIRVESDSHTIAVAKYGKV